MTHQEVIWFDSNSIVNKKYTENFLTGFETIFKNNYNIKKHKENILNKVGAGGIAIIVVYYNKNAKGSGYFLFSIKDNKCNAYESLIYNYGITIETIVKNVEKLVKSKLIEMNIKAEINMLCDTKRRNWKLRDVQKKIKEKTVVNRDINILSTKNVENIANTNIFKFAKLVGDFAKIKRKKIKYSVPIPDYLEDWVTLCKNGAKIVIVEYKYNKNYDSEKAMLIIDKDKIVEKWYTENIDNDTEIIQAYLNNKKVV